MRVTGTALAALVTLAAPLAAGLQRSAAWRRRELEIGA
jgi:hypothetical protein